MESCSHKILVLFFLPLVLYIFLLPVMPLMEPDEGRYALIPRAMNVSADYVTPHLKGVVYLEKPPLAYWATAAAYRIFGENEWSSRLFPALCAWGSILLAYFMGAFFHGRKTGLYGAAVLTTSLLPFVLGRVNILDMPLAFFLGWSVWSGFRYFAEEKKKRKRWLYLLYFGSALAFLTKGLIGVIFPFGIGAVWLLWMGRWRDLFRLISPVGIVIFLLVAGPWIYLVSRANTDFLFFFFVQEHFLRYTTAMHERTEPFYYYFLILLAGTLPWWPYLPKALQGIRGGAKLMAARTMLGMAEVRFFLTWTGLVVLFFSLSSSKLASYIAPVFAPLAVMMGHVFRSYEERSLANIGREGRHHFWLELPIFVQAALFAAVPLIPLFIAEYQRIGHPSALWFAGPILVQVLILVVPGYMKGKIASGWFLSTYLLTALYISLLLFPAAHYLTPGKSAYDVVRAIKMYLPRGEDLYQYKISLYGIDFYTGMRTPIVDDVGELKYGVERLPEKERRYYFPQAGEFIRDVRQGTGKYCITEGLGHVEGLKSQLPVVRVLWNNGKFYMLYVEGGK